MRIPSLVLRHAGRTATGRLTPSLPITQSAFRFFSATAPFRASEPASQDPLKELPSASTSTLPEAPVSVTSEGTTIAQEAVADMTMQFGDLQAMGLDKAFYNPVGIAQSLLEAIHISTGLPWWGTIAAATVIIRLSALPLILSVQRNAALLNNIRPQLDLWKDKMVQATQVNDRPAAVIANQKYRQIMTDSGAKPARMILMPITNGAMFISFFMALRQMSDLPVPQLAHGGLLWFENLNAPDPYYILPILASAGFLINFEVGSELGGANVMNPTMKRVFRGVSLLMPFMTYAFPSSVFVYWLTTNVFSVAQVSLLSRPGVRKVLGIPELIKHPKKPGDGGSVFDSFNKTIEDLQKGASAASTPVTSESIIKKAKATHVQPSRRRNKFSR
ncbi:60Kd inner membrane protein-domain-containing protein [Piptocephalis cylindrospora]|uniref:60Kd inner membrane protein-domain-containing protein n=1 Tax=Piptocephalis cylindrospora TaxID=1907219 RepID=A0A4P9XZT9_9FUNG|nr:60Kd inner membrane protein-domain-containing protein [Piptocephalis cylindrospora]|eukprot:RKP12003.1 60Kd inner membrane protein-domain-containing protein [Piptocephalis cylindrospora]